MATARRAEGRAALARTWRGPTLGPPIILLGGLYVLALALGMTTLLTPPRLVLVLDTSRTGQVRVAWDQPTSNLWDRGVRWRDRVLALDGRPPTRRDAGLWVGERLAVRGPTGRVTRVSAADLQAGRDPLPLLILSPWFFLLGLLVVLRAPHPHVGRAAYALFGSAACALALAPAADADAVVAGVAEFAAVLLFAASFLRFFLTFPRLRDARTRRAVLVAPLIVIALGLAGLAWPALAASAYRLRLLVLLVYLLLGAGVLARACVRERARDVRRGLTIMGAGTTLSILPFATLYLAPLLLHQPVRASAEHAALGLALLPVSFAYAILRHNVLDMRLLQRWLVYGLLWVLLLAPCTAVAYALYDWPVGGAPRAGHGLAAASLLALLAAVAFGPLYGRLRRRADHLFFRDSYDYRASLQDLSQGLSLASDLDTLGTEVPGTLCRLMNLDFAALLVQDGAGLGVRAAGAYQPTLLPALAAAVADVHDRPRVVPLASVYGYLTVLLVPLRTHGAVVGHLCLGPKATGEPFRDEDRDLLVTLSGHLAALVRNAQLVGELSAQVVALDTLNERLQHVQEEEWARLAADLHDEPLQTALSLQRRLVTVAAGSNGVDVPVALGQRLIAQLHALMRSARPPVLDDLGLLAALDLLAQERGAEAGTPITLDADPALSGRALAPGAQLVLYRAAQESLNNCLRHAHPRTIEVALRRHGTVARLRVSDDGGGFAPPARLDALVAHGHHGLAGLQARVQHAGGWIAVTSTPGGGTVVQVELPLAGGGGMIRVLLVDDHKLLLQGTRDALRAAADIAVVAEAAQGVEALRLAHELRPDVVLLDIKLPDISGIDVARTLHEDLPDGKIVILTGYHYEQYVRALFAIGVQGYLLKSDPELELIGAIRAVQRGEQALSVEIASTLAARTLRSGVAATPTLSDREREVLTLLARGRRNKEIARELGIETSTVETYISNAMVKLDVPTRIEAILAAIQRGAIALEE